MSEPIEAVLSRIGSQYSQRYHLGMLKFLAQSVVKHGQLESCNSVLEVYKKLETKCSDFRIAAALLRHMLRATGYEKEAELQSLSNHCANEFDLKTVAPSLPFYELLLILAKKLYKNNNYKRFLHSINDDRLDKSKHDVSSPIDMLQSMIHKNIITPDDLNTLHTLVTLLNDLEMLEEAKFLKQSLSQPGIAGYDGQTPVTLFSYFNFEGQLQQFSSQVEHNSESSLQQVSSETIEAVWTDQELRPLLDPELMLDGNIHEERNCCKALEQKRCTRLILLVVVLVSMVISGPFLCFNMPRMPEHTQRQPFYGPGYLTYSPFPNISIDRYYYNQINVTAIVADNNDYSRYNLTVCNTSSSIEVRSEQYQVKGVCPNNRLVINCYVNLHGYYNPRTDAQLFNLYMLQGSVLTVGLSTLTDVQLCITNSMDICSEVFNNSTKLMAHQVCQEVLTFNKLNDYTQTYTVRNSSYYCAVLLLTNSTQTVNYIANITLRSYIPAAPSHCQMKTQNQIKTQIFDLNAHQNIASKKHEVVHIIIQVTGRHLRNNITLISTVTSEVTSANYMIVGVVFAALTIVFVVVYLICIIHYKA